ncbi:MAG: Fusaric acid resistance protein-like, partial [Modestobacter sp.]|nr:Fusaric acid resistance protein-like [Modestobacter sp.]
LAALVEQAEADGEVLPWADDASLRQAAEQLRTSVDAIAHRLDTGENGCYVRSAALVALALDSLRRQPSGFAFALKDLTLLDGALARLATALEMRASDHDTTGLGRTTAMRGDRPSVTAPM